MSSQKDFTETSPKQHREHLEKLVAARTAELSAANKQLELEIAERRRAEAERERLLAAEQEQRVLAETMHEVTLALTSQTDPSAVLDEILHQAQRIVPFRAAHITLLEGDALRIVRGYGYTMPAEQEFVEDLVQPLANFPLDRMVVETRTPLTISDTQADPRWVTLSPTAWIRSYLSVPICLQNRVLGLLRLDSDIPGKFSAHDIQRLQMLANAAAIALENARLYAETQQRLKEQIALQEAGAVISSTLDLKTVLNYIVEHMGRAINATSAYISTFNPDFSWTVLAEYYGPEALPQERSESDVGHTYFVPEDDSGYIDSLFNDHVEIFHQDDPAIHPSIREHLQRFGAKSALLIPLRIGDQVVAFADLWESRRRREFSADEIALCRAIAQQAAVAIQNAQLHQQIHQQARQIQHVLDTVRAGIVLLDSGYRVILANPPGRAYLAVLTGIEIGQQLTRLGERPLAEVLRDPYPGLWHELTPVGQTRPIFRIYARPVMVDSVETEGWVIVMHDVTEDLEAQQRQQQQEKLAAIGQLAAGVAHDFNNILTGIIGFAELNRVAPEVPAPVREDLGYIVRQGQRAAQLVRQLLDFARKNVLVKYPLDFGHFLEDTVEHLAKTMPANIQLDLKLTPSQTNWMIKMDSGLIRQALTNLATNAIEAMPQGGYLEFSLSDFTLTPDQYPPCAEMQPDRWLVLTVTDTGVGMSPEVQKHLFEPFFTTKEVGQGPGLGLAQVEGIVKQHGGCIKVESQAGQGTTFTLYFPVLS